MQNNPDTQSKIKIYLGGTNQRGVESQPQKLLKWSFSLLLKLSIATFKKMQNDLPCEFNHQLVTCPCFHSFNLKQLQLLHIRVFFTNKIVTICCHKSLRLSAVTFVVTFHRHERLSGPELVIWLLPQHLLQIIVPDSPSLPPTVNHSRFCRHCWNW